MSGQIIYYFFAEFSPISTRAKVQVLAVISFHLGRSSSQVEECRINTRWRDAESLPRVAGTNNPKPE
jgi:hypothetical protein